MRHAEPVGEATWEDVVRVAGIDEGTATSLIGKAGDGFTEGALTCTARLLR